MGYVLMPSPEDPTVMLQVLIKPADYDPHKHPRAWSKRKWAEDATHKDKRREWNTEYDGGRRRTKSFWNSISKDVGRRTQQRTRDGRQNSRRRRMRVKSYKKSIIHINVVMTDKKASVESNAMQTWLKQYKVPRGSKYNFTSYTKPFAAYHIPEYRRLSLQGFYEMYRHSQQ